MRPEQLTWTDKQWASHLGCDAQDVPGLRQYMTEIYFPGIACDMKTGMYSFQMTKLDVAPSGAKRVRPFVSSDKEFESSERATRYANEEVLPRMAFSDSYVALIGVPTRAIQMLHIYRKQK